MTATRTTAEAIPTNRVAHTRAVLSMSVNQFVATVLKGRWSCAALTRVEAGADLPEGDMATLVAEYARVPLAWIQFGQLPSEKSLVVNPRGLAGRLKTAREARQISVGALAMACPGLSSARLAAVETGRVGLPWGVVEKAAALLDLPPGYLAFGGRWPTP